MVNKPLLRGEDLNIKQAWVRLAVLKQQKDKHPYIEFTCDFCKRKNRLPDNSGMKTQAQCGRCGELNYLGLVRVIENNI